MNEIVEALDPLPVRAGVAMQRGRHSVELRSTEHKVRIGLGIALGCLVVVAVVSYLALARLNENTAWVDHAHEVRDRLELLSTATTASENAERGYVITGEQSYVASYHQAAAAVLAQMAPLRALMADNGAQEQRLEAIDALVAGRLASLRSVVDARNKHGFVAAQAAILTGEGHWNDDRIRDLVAQMEATETALLGARELQARHSSDTAKKTIIGGGLLACAMVGLALVAIRRDFAGRTLVEQELREANDHLELRVRQRTAGLEKTGQTDARLASIIASSDDAIASKDLEGIITSWNPGAERIFGYSAQEALGQPMAMLIPPERADEEPMILARIARGDTTDHFETVRVRKDGRKINVSVTISPLRDSGGRIIGASKIARDITERKLAEVRLQAQLGRLNLLQHITRAIGERQDIQSIFQVVIRTLEDQLPLDFCCICLLEAADNSLIVTSVGSQSEALAMELAMSRQDRIEIDQNGLSRCVRGLLVYEPDIKEIKFPFPQRLARGALGAMVAAPLLVESKVFGVLIAARRQAHSFSSGDCEFLRQVSEHVALAAHQAQLHSALQQAYDDLRQTQKAVMQQERLRALGQMASGIAHDINNAISPVALYTETLLEKEPELSPRARSYLETIQRAIDDVARTVARMREFYRQREPQLTLSPVNLNALVPQVVDLTRARWNDMAQQRGIVIEVCTELAPELPAIMAADNEVREALINLIFNAVDAMPNGGPLTLRTQVRREQGFVQIEVIDTGIGMDEITRRRCLEPFFTTKGERGTGLGLAMVYGTIQRHSADIEIESAVGKGTTVRLSFAIPPTPALAVPASSDSRALPALQILVVDDDPLVLKALRDALEGEGHQVTTADGGQAGIDAFLAAREQGRAFPVVITDLGMPYVDGRKVATSIKSTAPDTIVLMLTGWGQRLLSDGDIPPHVDQVLGKPPKLRELREALARTLEARA